MKKNFSFLLLLTILIETLITSCKHDEQIFLVFNSPTIDLVSGTSLIYKDTILQTNQGFLIQINAKADSGLVLKNFVVTRLFNDSLKTELDSVLNTNQCSALLTFHSQAVTGTETWKFKITDNKENTCTKNVNITTISMPFILEFINDSGYIYNDSFLENDESFMAGIIASVNSNSIYKLCRFRINRIFNDISVNEIDTVIDTKIFTYTGDFFTKHELGMENWIFYIEDNNEQKDSINFKIYTEINDPMPNEFFGEIWNALGENPFIWDLVNNTSRLYSDNDSVKDMINSTTEYDTEPYFFVNGWYSANGTRFKLLELNSFDYDNPSYSSAVDAYSGSTIPSTFTWSVEEDNIYIAKLRNMEEYIAIKIISVEKTTDDNLDKIEFSYKKR
ncbi:MAG: hypothetical protein KAT68_02990 [Bacteroidales bacterium]|nr:hypothetical protein [Bacteroidales bacterium]